MQARQGKQQWMAIVVGEGRSLQQALAPGASFGGPVVPLNASVQVPPGYIVKAVWRGIGTQNYTNVNGAYALVGAYGNYYAQGSSAIVGRVVFVPNGTAAPYPVITSVDSNVGLSLMRKTHGIPDRCLRVLTYKQEIDDIIDVFGTSDIISLCIIDICRCIYNALHTDIWVEMRIEKWEIWLTCVKQYL